MHTLVYCKSNQQNRLSKKINQNQWTLGFVGSICFHNFHQVLWHWEHARDERVWTRDLQKVQRCKSHFQNINMVRAQHYTIYIHTSKCGIFLLFLWSLYISNSVWNHACNTRAMSHTEILRCWQEHYTLYLPYYLPIEMILIWYNYAKATVCMCVLCTFGHSLPLSNKKKYFLISFSYIKHLLAITSNMYLTNQF